MKISYDKEVDAIYLKILDLKPEGVIGILGTLYLRFKKSKLFDTWKTSFEKPA